MNFSLPSFPDISISFLNIGPRVNAYVQLPFILSRIRLDLYRVFQNLSDKLIKVVEGIKWMKIFHRTCFRKPLILSQIQSDTKDINTAR